MPVRSASRPHEQDTMVGKLHRGTGLRFQAKHCFKPRRPVKARATPGANRRARLTASASILLVPIVEANDMTKITDNQRAVLKAAATSANLVAWPVPRNLGLNPGSATIVVKGLIKKGLLVERAALGEDAVWREDEDGRKLTIVITKAGFEAVGMLPDGEGDEAPAPQTDDERPETSPTDGHTAATAAVSGQPKAPRPGSKLAAIVALLSRAEGATVAEMAEATGWQQHSVRGVMSGALVKKFGLTIVSEPDEARGRVYRTE